jgi:uncharacterized MnhB-related membrane protein
MIVSDERFYKQEETMIRTVAIGAFGLALASAAQAMPVSTMHQPDSAITQARMGCGMGRVMVNGVCQSRAGMRQERRAMRRCARYSGGVCVR